MAVTMIAVTGVVEAPEGTASTGVATFKMPTPLVDVDGNLLHPASTYRTVLEDGEFVISLPATDSEDVLPLTWTFEVDIALSGNVHIRGALAVPFDSPGGAMEFASGFELNAESESAALYVRRHGDTMTGPLVLSGAPTQDLHAATKKYVDDNSGGGGGGGAVDSVFGRTGAVVAVTNDYSVAQINGLTTALGTKVDKVSSADRLYGTDGSSAQTTYGLSGASVASTVALRRSDGQIRAATIADGGSANGSDLINRDYAATALALKANLAGGAAFTGTVTVGAQAVVVTNDSRLTDSRTPTAHAASHTDGGADELTITVDQIPGMTATLNAKADLEFGQVPASQIPSIAITEFLGTVASQVAMLALSGQKGDWAIRSDLGTSWVITGTDPTQLASWTALSYPAAPVTSVAGRTGTITLGVADVSGAAPLASPTFTGTVAGITAAMVSAQPVDSDLTTIAGLTATTDSFMQAKGSAWTTRTVAQVLADLAVPGTTFQPLDSDLTTIAGLTATTDNVLQSKAGAWSSRTLAQLSTDLLTPLQTAGLAPKASPALTGTATAVNLTATGRIQPGFFTIADAATLVIDASLGNTGVVVLGGNRVIGTPTNGGTHQRLMLVLAQDGAGGRTPTLDTGIKDPNAYYTGINTGANKISYLGIAYDGVQWNVLAFATGYN